MFVLWAQLIKVRISVLARILMLETKYLLWKINVLLVEGYVIIDVSILNQPNMDEFNDYFVVSFYEFPFIPHT